MMWNIDFLEGLDFSGLHYFDQTKPNMFITDGKVLRLGITNAHGLLVHILLTLG